MNRTTFAIAILLSLLIVVGTFFIPVAWEKLQMGTEVQYQVVLIQPPAETEQPKESPVAEKEVVTEVSTEAPVVEKDVVPQVPTEEPMIEETVDEKEVEHEVPKEPLQEETVPLVIDEPAPQIAQVSELPPLPMAAQGGVSVTFGPRQPVVQATIEWTDLEVAPVAVEQVAVPQVQQLPVYVEVAGDVTPPVFDLALIQKNIVYPQLAKKQGRDGTVLLELCISLTGVIDSISVLMDPGYGMAKAAVAAFEGIICTPAKLNGTPIAVRMEFPIRFASQR